MRPLTSGSNGYILPQQHPSPTTENNAQKTEKVQFKVQHDAPPVKSPRPARGPNKGILRSRDLSREAVVQNISPMDEKDIDEITEQNKNTNKQLTFKRPDNVEPPHPKNRHIPRLNTNRDYEAELQRRLTDFFDGALDIDKIARDNIDFDKTDSSAEDYAGDEYYTYGLLSPHDKSTSASNAPPPRPPRDKSTSASNAPPPRPPRDKSTSASNPLPPPPPPPRRSKAAPNPLPPPPPPPRRSKAAPNPPVCGNSNNINMFATTIHDIKQKPRKP